MDDRATDTRDGVPAGDDVLNETDVHAGDDVEWEVDELDTAVPLEPSMLPFWKGLVLGLLLATVAWCVVGAVVFALHRALT